MRLFSHRLNGCLSSDYPTGVEPDAPRSRFLIIVLILHVPLLFAVVLASKEVLLGTFRDYQYRDFAALDSSQAMSRERIDAELNGYAEVDAAKGIYKIPVTRAMELLIERQSLEPVTQSK